MKKTRISTEAVRQKEKPSVIEKKTLPGYMSTSQDILTHKVM